MDLIYFLRQKLEYLFKQMLYFLYPLHKVPRLCVIKINLLSFIVILWSRTGSILGKSPTNWVWHHHVDGGIMQLVPKSQHTVGGSFWSTMHPGNKGGFQFGENKI